MYDGHKTPQMAGGSWNGDHVRGLFYYRAAKIQPAPAGDRSQRPGPARNAFKIRRQRDSESRESGPARINVYDNAHTAAGDGAARAFVHIPVVDQVVLEVYSHS